jgi:hypothetical protein
MLLLTHHVRLFHQSRRWQFIFSSLHQTWLDLHSLILIFPTLPPYLLSQDRFTGMQSF